MTSISRPGTPLRLSGSPSHQRPGPAGSSTIEGQWSPRCSFEGYAAANADVIALSDGMVIRAKRNADGLVGLVVANGSGHEPAMTGWVGRTPRRECPGAGVLIARAWPILAGLREADCGAGVLLLVSSHAGDIMNASVR